MANRNFASGGKIYSMHVMPVLLDCNFVVTPSNSAGISSLKGPAISSVYMNSSSPSSSNPDPIDGTIVVRLADNYNKLFSMSHSIIAPPSGTDVKIDNSVLVPGTPYTITTLGDASLAKFRSIGLPAGITPAVGVSFIASNNGGAGNVLTTRVQASIASGVATIEMVSNPNQSIAPDPALSQGIGSQIILQCRDYAGALVAPAPGSIISLSFYLSNSSVTVQGE